jgi:molybdenum cofactor cytidylyltransferase
MLCGLFEAARPWWGGELRSGEATLMKKPPTVIVLAAGRGSRFKAPAHKLLQPLGASTVLGTTLEHAIETGLQVRVVATAAVTTEAGRHVAQRDIVELPEVTGHKGERLGMGYSIAAGVAASSDAGGWLVLPADMPQVKPTSMLAVAARLPLHAVVYAQHIGRRGHPVAFASELYSELVQLTGDEGARRLVARYPSFGVELDDPGVLVDIDTIDDLAALHAPARPDPKRQRAQR